jgi:hypothetical protein
MSHFSLSKKFIFIHVPKTGGVAMLDYLNKIKDIQKVQDKRDKLGIRRSGWDDNHYYYSTTMETLSGVYPSIDFSEFNVFGVIRNPYHRMVSMFLHRLRKPKYNTAEDQKVLSKGFEYWLLNTKHRADKHIVSRSQLEWFDGCNNPKVICQSKLNTNWLKEVSNTSLMEGVLPVKHTSNKPIDTYDRYHTNETIQHIQDIFSRDIEWGEYSTPDV